MNYFFLTPSLLGSILNMETDTIMAYIAITTGLFTIIAAFVTWRIDRGRLLILEKDQGNMKEEIKVNKEAYERGFEQIYKNIHDSNKETQDKVDKLTMFLLNSKITLKGEKQDRDE